MRNPVPPAGVLRHRALASVVVVLVAIALAAPTSTVAARPAPIVNGAEVTAPEFAAQWTFMAILRWDSQTFHTDLFCAANLLTPRLLVTAAHCLDGTDAEFEQQAGESGDISVVFGRRVASGTDGEQHTIADVRIHPAYNSVTTDNDVALIELATPSTRPSIALIDDTESDLWGGGAGIEVTPSSGPWIAGWGASGSGQPITDALHAASVNIAPDSVCGTGGLAGSVNLATMFCSGQLSPPAPQPVDACQGDSGGPLLVSDDAGGRRLVGIASWGIGCGGSDYGVYTRLPAFLPWIREQACAMGIAVDGWCADATPPTSPQLSSASHQALTWSVDDTVTVSLAGATDDRRLGGYSIAWSTNATTVPDATVEAQPSTTQITSPPLPSGTQHHFSIVAVDAAGNLSPVARIGPFWIDRTPPTRPGAVRVLARRGRHRVRTLAWRRSTDNRGIGRYRILRRTGTDWKLVGTTRAARTSFTIPQGSRRLRRVYAVEAVDLSGLVSQRSRPLRA